MFLVMCIEGFEKNTNTFFHCLAESEKRTLEKNIAFSLASYLWFTGASYHWNISPDDRSKHSCTQKGD